MDFDATFPLRLYLNETRHDERRRAVENALLDAGIDGYERLSGYQGKWAESWRGYPSADRYAQALSHRRAVWTGWRRKAAAVAIFEDDVVLTSGFKDRLLGIELPADWGVFCFGCRHRERPVIVAPGLVRCTLTSDMHAYAVRASDYQQVARALTPFGKRSPAFQGGELRSCDEQLALLCDKLPVYAAWPNLAWRMGRGSEDDEAGMDPPYTPEGRQTTFPEAVAGLDDEMRKRFGKSGSSRTVTTRPGGLEQDRWLFCRTVEDVGLGERLRGLTSLRLLAKLNSRTACLWWPDGMLKLPAEHDEILEANGYRCVSDEQEWKRLTRGKAELDRTSCALRPEAVIEVVRQRGLCEGRSDDDLLGAWRRLARDLRPSRLVHSRVTAALESWQSTRPLGLHICRVGRLRIAGPVTEAGPPETPRGGNASGEPPGSDQYQEPTPELLALLHRQDFDALFLACDDPTAEDGWREWLEARSIRILGSNRVWRAGRVNGRSIEDEAVDMFLLSRCDLVVASEWSVASWMASVVGGVGYEVVVG